MAVVGKVVAHILARGTGYSYGVIYARDLAKMGAPRSVLETIVETDFLVVIADKVGLLIAGVTPIDERLNCTLWRLVTKVITEKAIYSLIVIAAIKIGMILRRTPRQMKKKKLTGTKNPLAR